MPKRGEVRSVSTSQGVRTQVFGKDGQWHTTGPKPAKASNATAKAGGVSNSTAQKQQISALEKSANQASSMNGLGRNKRKPLDTGSSMKLGSSAAGSAWVDAILHPCMEPSNPCDGIPDKSSAVVVSPLYKSSSNISKLASITNPTYDLMIAFLPVPELDYVYRQRANASDPWTSWQVIYGPNFSQNPNGTAITLGVHGYGKGRITGEGHTLHLRASATTNQGTVFAGQIETLDWDREYSTGANVAQGEPLAKYAQHRLPTTSSELVSLDPAMIEWEAMNGVYMPLRYSNDNWRYYDTATGDVLNYLGTSAFPTEGVLPASWVQLVDGAETTPSDVVLPAAPTFTLPGGAPTNIQRLIYGTSDMTPFLTGVVIFEGLSQAASVQVKSRKYMENQLEPLDGGVNQVALAVRPFAKQSPMYDPIALEVVAVTSQSAPHAYPAEANDFGTVMKSIWNTLKTVGRHILGATDLAAAAGIPGAAVASGIGHAVETIGSALGL